MSAALVAAAFLASGCGGGSGGGPGGSGGGGSSSSSGGSGSSSGGGGGTPSCSSFAADACAQATYGYPTKSTAQLSSSHTLLSVDGAACTFVMARTDMNPGSCGDIYACGGASHTLSWGPHSYPPVNSWSIDNMFLTCSGGGGGGCTGKCSSCIDACRGISGCCCGSGCICESDCTPGCGDNC